MSVVYVCVTASDIRCASAVVGIYATACDSVRAVTVLGIRVSVRQRASACVGVRDIVWRRWQLAALVAQSVYFTECFIGNDI
jgi:hypothetical protein